MAVAHGPGLEQIGLITAKIADEGASPELYVERARVYQDNQHYQEALADFEKAAELDPGHAEYDLDRAQLHYDSGEYLIALDFVDLYLVRQAPTIDALLLKARVHRSLDQPEPALDAYRQALSDVSGSNGRPLPEWYLEYANALAGHGETDAAVQVLQTGIGELGPISVFQVRAAELEVELGEYDAALNRIDSILQQSQRKDIWLARRGDILSAAGRDTEARQDYERALNALRQLPARLRNLPVSSELASTLQARLETH